MLVFDIYQSVPIRPSSPPHDKHTFCSRLADLHSNCTFKYLSESCLSLQQISKFRSLALILNKPSNINHRRYAAVDTKAMERQRPLQIPKVTKTMKRIWQPRYAFNKPVKSCRETPEVTQAFEWCQGGERFLIFAREQLVQALALTHMKLGTDA